MTREDAIKKLIDLLPEEFLSEYADAIKMGIEALEQEPCEVSQGLVKDSQGFSQELCGDCISRESVVDTTICEGISCNECGFNTCEDGQPGCLLKERVDKLPSVTPQPKMGHWIDIMVGDMPAQRCDKCNAFYPLAYTGGGHKFCPNCGAKMQEIPTGSERGE